MFGRRQIKITKIVWHSEWTRLREQVRAIVTTPKNKAAFGPEYLKEVAEAALTLERRQVKLWAINAILLSALFIQLFTGKSEFSVLGISIKDLREVREILLIVSISLDLMSGIMHISLAELKSIREVLLETLYENKVERELKAAVLPYFWKTPIRSSWPLIDHTKPTQLALIGFLVVILSMLMGVVVLVVALLIPLGIQVSAWWQILQNPTLSEPWNNVVLAGTAAGIIGSLAFVVFHRVRLPFEDFSVIHELMELEKKDKKAYEKRINEIAEEQLK
jgi:hypothetical protein